MHRLTDNTVLADLLDPVSRALARVRQAAVGRTLTMPDFIALGVLRQRQGAHSTPFGHLFHRHPAGDSTGIRPPVPPPFGRGSRSEATQAGHCYSAGVVGVNVRA